MLKNIIEDDIRVYTNVKKNEKITYRDFLKAYKEVGFRFIFFWRLAKSKNLLSPYAKFMKHRIGKKNGIEIGPTVEIGGGFRMLHPFAITINSKSKIGRNVTILKGATLGNQKRGTYEGSPVIGDNVYIGLNSSIVGNVIIENDVLIGPNAYVNRNVSAHTVVIAAFPTSLQKKDATKGYIPSI